MTLLRRTAQRQCFGPARSDPVHRDQAPHGRHAGAEMLACYERPEDIARPIAGAADAIFFEVPTVCRVILRIHRTLTSQV